MVLDFKSEVLFQFRTGRISKHSDQFDRTARVLPTGGISAEAFTWKIQAQGGVQLESAVVRQESYEITRFVVCCLSSGFTQIFSGRNHISLLAEALSDPVRILRQVDVSDRIRVEVLYWVDH